MNGHFLHHYRLLLLLLKPSSSCKASQPRHVRAAQWARSAKNVKKPQTDDSNNVFSKNLGI